ncbi:hypothetical protein [Polymorphobacter sp.]|uniref:hypothetical protein n=1 Tax=Polymorphobacter sp. TaxID=1909290 RepID=UPI003F727847
MESIYDQILGTLNAGFPFAALHIALALPDVCATLELPPGAKAKANVKARYNTWFNKYLAENYTLITGFDLFALRNGLLHNGQFGHQDFPFERVIFFVNRIGFHNNIINGALQLDTYKFCEDVIDAAKHWQSDHVSDRNVASNMAKLVQYYPHGFPPYVLNVEVIT